MSDSKIYMFPEGGNTGSNSMWPLMAMNGGIGNSQWNNPFIYLVWMMFANRFFGNNGWGEGFAGQGALNLEVQSQLSAIREQMSDNLNTGLLMDAIKGNGTAVGQLASQLNCDFNTLNAAICDVRGGIDKVAGAIGLSGERVINAAQMGDANIVSQLNQCCCTLRDAITQLGYLNQLAIQGLTNTLQNSINFVNSSVERGFAATNFETAQLTCAITKAILDSTSLILAGQKAAEMRELQREIQTLRDEKNAFLNSALIQSLTLSLVNQLRPCPIPAYITCNPFGCQGDNYPYGVYNGNGSCGGY